MTFFLGLKVNQSSCGIFINQSKYVLEILNKYGMESCDPVGTPMEIKDKLDLDQNGTPVDATPILTKNQLRSDGDMCMYALTISTMEPKNVKEAMTKTAWIESMQEELLQFKKMDVWVLVPAPDNISPLT
nr:retrotransposon protein, putative, unclassified [Tanacetum cinerariifolium]